MVLLLLELKVEEAFAEDVNGNLDLAALVEGTVQVEQVLGVWRRLGLHLLQDLELFEFL